MEDSDKLENEIEQMLNSLQTVDRHLSSNRNRSYVEKEINNLSTQITGNAKKVDTILNKIDLFEETNEELEAKLRSLETEKEKAQEEFDEVKAAAGKIVCPLSY